MANKSEKGEISPEQQIQELIQNIEKHSKIKRLEELGDESKLVTKLETPEGEKFSVEKTENPKDESVVKSHDLLKKTFGKNEVDSLETIQEAMEEDPPVIVHNINNESGEAVATAHSAILNSFDEDFEKKGDKGFMLEAYTVVDKENQGKNLGLELYRRRLSDMQNQAQAQGVQMESIIAEVEPDTPEQFYNSVGLKRCYYENAKGDLVEVPYEQSVLVDGWNSKTGKPLPDHENTPLQLMIAQLDGRTEISTEELLEKVRSIMDYDSYLTRGDFKNNKAFKQHEKVLEDDLAKLEKALSQAKDGKIKLMSAVERDPASADAKKDSGKEDEPFDAEAALDQVEANINKKLDSFKKDGELDPEQKDEVTTPEEGELDNIDKDAEKAADETHEDVKNLKDEEIVKTPEMEKFFGDLKLADFKDPEKLREKFKEIFTEEHLKNLNLDPNFKDQITDRYFDDINLKMEDYLRIAQAGESKDKGMKQEAKKFLKGMWGGGLYAAANRAVMTGLKTVTTVGLPLKILAGGATGAAVSGINYALGRSHEALAGKGLKKLVNNVEKGKNSSEIEQNVLAQIEDDLSLLMEFDQNKFKMLNEKDKQLEDMNNDQLSKIFTDSDGGWSLEAYEKSSDIGSLMKYNKEAKHLKGSDLDMMTKERQTLIKKLIDNGGLNEYISWQIKEEITKIKESQGEIDPALETKLIKQAHLAVERDMNNLLGDVVAQEKFDEIDEKGKTSFEKSYLAKLVGKGAPQNLMQALTKGFVSGSVAGLAYTDTISGGIYMAVQRMQGTLRAETLKRGDSFVKTPAEIISELEQAGREEEPKEDEAKAKTEKEPEDHTAEPEKKSPDSTADIKTKIIEARARIKLPDIKEIDRVKIEKAIKQLENNLIAKSLLADTETENENTIEDTVANILTAKEQEVSTAVDLAEKEKKRKSLLGVAKQFMGMGAKEKAKILLKTGWEGVKGGTAGAFGAEMVNMGGAAMGGEDFDIKASAERGLGRLTFGASELFKGGESAQPDTSNTLAEKMHTGNEKEVQDFINDNKIDADSVKAVQQQVEAEKELGVNSSDKGMSQAELDTLAKQLSTEENGEKAQAVLNSLQEKGVITPEQYFKANHALLEHAGFKIEQASETDQVTGQTVEKNNLSLELGKDGAPEFLERVFYRMGIDNADIGNEIDNLKAARVLNVGANLRVLTEGHDVAGITAEDFNKYVTFEDGKLEINDYDSFKENILDKLTDHSETLITPENLPKSGAHSVVDNLLHDTWKEMANSENSADVDINIDPQAVDQAEQHTFQGTLEQSGIAELTADIDYTDEDTATFTTFSEKVVVQDNKVISVGENKLEKPIVLGTKSGGDQLLDEVLKVRSEAMLAKYEDRMKTRMPELELIDIKPEIQISPEQAEIQAKYTIEKIGIEKGLWTSLQNKSVEDLVNDNIQGDKDQDIVERDKQNTLKQLVLKNIRAGVIDAPSAGGPQKIGEAIQAIAEKQTQAQIDHDLKVAERIVESRETTETVDIIMPEPENVEQIIDLAETGHYTELKDSGLNPDIQILYSPEAKELLDKYGQHGIQFEDKGVSFLGGNRVVSFPTQEVEKVIIDKTADGNLSFTTVNEQGERSRWGFTADIDEADNRWQTAETLTAEHSDVNMKIYDAGKEFLQENNIQYKDGGFYQDDKLVFKPPTENVEYISISTEGGDLKILVQQKEGITENIFNKDGESVTVRVHKVPTTEQPDDVKPSKETPLDDKQEAKIQSDFEKTMNDVSDPRAAELYYKRVNDGVEFPDINSLNKSELIDLNHKVMDQFHDLRDKVTSGVSLSEESKQVFSKALDGTTEILDNIKARLDGVEKTGAPTQAETAVPETKIDPATHLDRVQTENGKISAQFFYDKNGEAQKFNISGTIFGFDPAVMLNENYDKMIEDAWEKSDKEVKIEDMDNEVKQAAQATELKRQLLADLDKNNQGQTPEAKLLRESIDYQVDDMEKRYGDIFKDNLKSTSPAPETKPDAATEQSNIDQTIQDAIAQNEQDQLNESLAKADAHFTEKYGHDLSDEYLVGLREEQLQENLKLIRDEITNLETLKAEGNKAMRDTINTIIEGFEEKQKMIDKHLKK